MSTPLAELAKDLADLSKTASDLAGRETRGESHFDNFSTDLAALLDRLEIVYEENRHAFDDEDEG